MRGHNLGYVTEMEEVIEYNMEEWWQELAQRVRLT